VPLLLLLILAQNECRWQCGLILCEYRLWMAAADCAGLGRQC